MPVQALIFLDGSYDQNVLQIGDLPDLVGNETVYTAGVCPAHGFSELLRPGLQLTDPVTRTSIPATSAQMSRATASCGRCCCNLVLITSSDCITI